MVSCVIKEVYFLQQGVSMVAVIVVMTLASYNGASFYTSYVFNQK